MEASGYSVKSTLTVALLLLSSSAIQAGAEEPSRPSEDLRAEAALYEATIDVGATGDGVTDLERSLEYVRSFPNGRHAGQVHQNLGFLYSDILKILLSRKDGKFVGYKEDCYSKYVTDEKLDVQIERARGEAIRHIKAALEMVKGKEDTLWLKSALNELERGDVPMFWVGCTD